MESKSVSSRENVTKSTIWKHKNAFDKSRIHNKLEKQLASDILRLFENSQFVDLKLESANGFIYSHRVVVAVRYPACWSLLAEIGHIQFKLNRNTHPLDTDTVLTVSLPSINFQDLKTFIRSLYTNKVDDIAGIALRVYLESHLLQLKKELGENRKLFLQKLNFSEEKKIHKQLLLQLRRGEISEERGNLRDVTHLVPAKVKCQSSSSQCGNSRVPGGFALTTRIRRYNSVDNGNINNGRVNGCTPSRIPVIERPLSKRFCLPNDNCKQSKMNSTINSKKLKDSSDPKENIKSVTNLLEYYPVSSSKSTSSEDEPVTQFSKKCPSVSGIASITNISNGNDVTDSKGGGKGVRAKIKRFVGLKNKMPSADSIICNNNNPVRFRLSSEHSSFENENSKFNVESSLDEADSDPNGLHETSSLEVELPSSHGDQSLSPDSVRSEESSCRKVENDNDLNCVEDSSSNVMDCDSSTPDTNTHKPLVRTRTFDLIEPTCASLYLQEEDNNNDRRETNTQSPDFTDLEKASSSYQEVKSVIQNLDVKTSEENQDKIREIERKKGSLLFENSIQTFSNIPTSNMMNISVNSDGGSVGLTTLYKSMMDSSLINSFHSVGGNDSHVPDTTPTTSATTFLSTSLRDSNLPHSVSPLCLNTLDEQIKINKYISDNQSPSPDSLCVDPPFSNSKYDSNSLSKEDFDFEEKEKDEQENHSKNSSSTPPQEKAQNFNVLKDKFSVDSKSELSESPRLECKDDDKPIVTGGVILRESHPRTTQRQISAGSVKDVDSIPLVCGYISPEETDVVENDTTKNIPQDEQNQNSQSMFSMFINFDEIPSPATEPPPLPPKSKPHPTGGMYMFIEADSTSSPKPKRRNKLEMENKKNFSPLSKPEFNLFNTTTKSESNLTNFSFKPESNITNPTFKPEPNLNIKNNNLLHNSPVPVSKIKGKLTTDNDDDPKDKKGFFAFIEVDKLSKGNSPKPKRRPNIPRKISKKEQNVMSKSAPSDCLLFTKDESSKSSATESSNKLMTKSVIDREEFMAQPPTRRNVSLNDKINESSKIPRPVPNFKERLLLEHPKRDFKPPKKKNKDFELIKSLEGSMSEAATSMSVSFSDMASSLAPDVEDVSEFSDVSSLLSSIDRSNNEPSSELDNKETLNSLGDDLLKMFVNEINTDVVIQIGERKIKAHKCILASRCVYFAAMLSGHWVESAGNVIKLQGFSPDAVIVALKHIYSGSSTVPEGVKVGELAALADMLALDGLKEVVSQNLKANMCHYFHKPCSECVNGVLEVLAIAGAFCLEELYHKCLQWIAKHFCTVIPNRNFASLPPELQERCLKQIVDDMSISNVIDTALGGEKTLTILPVVRWAQPIFDVTAQLLEAATNFIATNLSGVLASDRFLELGRDGGWNGDSLEDTLKMACEMIRPDEAVLAHIQLTKLTEGQEEGTLEFSENYIRMLERLLKQVEKFIIHNANRVAVCRKWPLLPPDTQKRIKDAALVVIEFSKPLAPRPKLSSASRIRSRGNSIEPVQRLRTSSMTDHRLSRSASANVVPHKHPPSVSIIKKVSNGRCHTPPPSVIRATLQTPPPTRASTLRAQARQSAIQRSQSARTVAEKVKKLQPTQLNDTSTDNESSSQPNSQQSGAAVVTRSRTSSQGSSHFAASAASRSSTPGLSDRAKHKRNASGPQLTTVNRALGNDGEDVFQRRSFGEQETTSLRGQSSNSRNFLRAISVDGHKNPRSFSIGASPIHHLGSVREIPPRDPKKPVIQNRMKGRPSMGRRVKSPMREACRGVPSNMSPLAQVAIPVQGQREIVVGLGSRSNTFCKDEGPNPALADLENE